MASFASSATTDGARKHAWTNIFVTDVWFMVFKRSVLENGKKKNTRINPTYGYGEINKNITRSATAKK